MVNKIVELCLKEDDINVNKFKSVIFYLKFIYFN